MPIYEYRCLNCDKKFEKLILKDIKTFCPKCKSKNVERIISRVRYHKTEGQRINELDLSKPQDESFYRDSRNVGLTTKKRLKEMGVNLGDRFEEKVEKARTGKLEELQD